MIAPLLFARISLIMNSQLGIFKYSKNNNKKVKFSDWDIIGHETQIEYLQSNISQGDLAHAYLFTGEEQVGKKRVALVFIKSLLCDATSKPCGKCAPCLQIDRGIHPDAVFLSGNESIKIGEIRELISRMSLKPFNSAYKIAVIDNAERLTPEASNALLKTLEEPPGEAVLILTTKDYSNLLPTIVSRLRIIKFFKAASFSIRKILDKKKITIEKKELISIVSMGRPGRALELLEKPDEVEEVESWLKEFLRLLKQGKAEKLNYSSKLAKINSSDPDKALRIITFWVIILRDIINYKNIPGYKSLTARLLGDKSLEKLDTNNLIHVVKYISAMRTVIANPSSGFNVKLIFDLLVLKLNKLNIYE